MTDQALGAVVRREVTVDAPIERAFDVFTNQMATWWPHDSHHVGAMPADAVMEPLAGGRCYSRAHDGTECDWGRVLRWEPPDRVVFAWLLTPRWEFEPDPANASEVEVRFAAAGEGRTHVVLTHGGFERYADGGDEMRRQVGEPGGWGILLERFAAGVAA
ncbi:MAG TPA: SRPBCC family protein [Solirubrobacteraceae bacterium]|nr:SRPBCC family protein [Solirubrobacteraceae bacterium]HSD80580.1 SRPBCC family protein [Solirubrobacteraceae bacterium]